jgi:putative sigma-54 modulation protein
MNIHYTGRQVELSEAQKKKLEDKLRKIQKILGKWYEPEVHVILSLVRRLYHSEVTLNFRHHTLVVECSGADLFSAAQEAAEKLEKQVIRNKDRWRELKRRPKPVWETAAGETAVAPPGKTNGSPAPPRPRNASRRRAPAGQGAGFPRIFRTVTPSAKPLTIEEAVLEMEQDDRDCVVYQDAERGRLSILFRRRDGNLELIEA